MATNERITIIRDTFPGTSGWRILVSAPIIYFMFIPLALADFFLEFYHQVCFRLYGIPLVPRRRYIRLDRQRLAYLDGWSKLNCIYCGYANGLAHYASIIFAATELYWCPIRHRTGGEFIPPKHHEHFAEYGNVEQLREVLKNNRLRLDLREVEREE